MSESDGEVGSARSKDRFNDVLTGIGAVLGLISAAAAAVGAWQSTAANKEAEKAKIAVEAATSRFSERQYNDVQQFKVSEKIESLLREEKSGSLVLAVTYISLVEDPKAKAVWCSAVISYAQIRASELTPAESSAMLYAKDCLNEVAARQRAEADAAAAAAQAANKVAPAAAAQTPPVATTTPPPVQVTAPATSTALAWRDKDVLADGNASGWDIDVFACESGGATSYEQARKIGTTLASKASASEKLARESLGRIRLRILPRSSERVGFPVGKNQVQADADGAERRLATEIAKLASSTVGKGFLIGSSTSGTAYYLSVFACAG